MFSHHDPNSFSAWMYVHVPVMLFIGVVIGVLTLVFMFTPRRLWPVHLIVTLIAGLVIFFGTPPQIESGEKQLMQKHHRLGNRDQCIRDGGIPLYRYSGKSHATYRGCAEPHDG